ncbi:MAG: MarR family winged helix-turn-helix transcriptional regulator [Chloroflexota bacterium]
MTELTNFVLDPHTHEGDTAAKIVFSLERLSHIFRIHWWEQTKNFQLSPLQMQILTILRFQLHLNSVSAIARYLELADATVSDAVRVLGQKQHVEKKPDSEDGRRHTLTLTPTGVAVAEELALFANRIRDFASALPNQGELLESLLLLMQSLQQNGFIPMQQMCTTCRHLRHGDDAPFSYYCQLLARPLAVHDLRIHCPEHEVVG